jgi:hypothetical protein
MIGIMVPAPAVAILAVATFAGLSEFMPVMVGLTAINSVTVAIVVQSGFPLLDVSVTTVNIICPDGRRAAE